jgi:hypothetical protein
VTAGGEFFGNMAADEARAAGNEDLHIRCADRATVCRFRSRMR